jgi:hypothetical protein
MYDMIKVFSGETLSEYAATISMKENATLTAKDKNFTVPLIAFFAIVL